MAAPIQLAARRPPVSAQRLQERTRRWDDEAQLRADEDRFLKHYEAIVKFTPANIPAILVRQSASPPAPAQQPPAARPAPPQAATEAARQPAPVQTPGAAAPATAPPPARAGPPVPHTPVTPTAAPALDTSVIAPRPPQHASAATPTVPETRRPGAREATFRFDEFYGLDDDGDDNDESMEAPILYTPVAGSHGAQDTRNLWHVGHRLEHADPGHGLATGATREHGGLHRMRGSLFGEFGAPTGGLLFDQLEPLHMSSPVAGGSNRLEPDNTPPFPRRPPP